MINKLHRQIKILNIGPSSKLSSIDSISKDINIKIPQDYILFLQYKNDFEFSIGDVYIRIWGADGCIELNEAYNVSKQLPNSLAIGDDGGGGLIMYLFGLEGFGLYYCRMADLDINEAVKISNGLLDLLVNGEGIDILINSL